MKIVIVGGVAGGASAAARARRLSEAAEIVVIERGVEPSFANCGLPYYIGGAIPKRTQLLVAPKQRLEQWYGLDVRTLHEVESIDRSARKVVVHDLANDTRYEESYDKLVLSPGAVPARPSIPGADLDRVYTLRDLSDADRMHKVMRDGVKRVVVIGAGLIGLEMTENLVRLSIETTLVELADQVLPPWDREMTTPIVERLTSKNVRLFLSDSAKSIEAADDGLHVKLASGDRLSADCVILSVGVRPENRLAQEAGLETGPSGGIRVNTHMQTSDPDIYAVGDAVQVVDCVSGEPAQIPLAGPANRQGRIAADHVFGRDSSYRGTQGTAILGLFGATIAMTGLSEKTLKRLGRPYGKVYVHPPNHAGYYPGAEPMTLKLLFDPESGRVLGAQGVGGAGVDKRIDVLSVAVQTGMTVYDLEEMELAYAPQFGSAKDAVNMLGFVAAGVLRGDQPVLSAEELREAVAGGAVLLDVRMPKEFADGAIPEAINIPLPQLRSRLAELPPSQQIVVYCKVGFRGYLGTCILRQNGFDAVNLTGGYTTYRHYQGVDGM